MIATASFAFQSKRGEGVHHGAFWGWQGGAVRSCFFYLCVCLCVCVCVDFLLFCCMANVVEHESEGGGGNDKESLRPSFAGMTTMRN